MNAQSKNEYLMIFRGNEWHKGLSPEEIQKVAGDWMGWFNRMTQQGQALAGSPLEPEGKVISGKGGRVVADGPFAESKEAIGGYILLRVGSFDEAVALAKQCPGLPYGAVVEVRPIAAECPIGCKGRSEAELVQHN